MNFNVKYGVEALQPIEQTYGNAAGSQMCTLGRGAKSVWLAPCSGRKLASTMKTDYFLFLMFLVMKLKQHI